MTKKGYRQKQLVKQTGELVFGDRWKAQLAKALDVIQTIYNYNESLKSPRSPGQN